MGNKKIEITQEQLAEASTKVMSSERMHELLSNVPVLALAFAVFSAELAKTLFEEENNE